MNTTLLNSIRKSKGFSRSVTYLIILALVGVVTERIIYYTLADNDVIEEENVVERINRLAPHQARRLGLPKSYEPAPPSQEAKLSHTLLDVQQNLATLASPERDKHAASLAALEDLKAQLQSLDREAREDFAAIEQHIKDKRLPEVIMERHEKAVALYEEEMANLLSGLAAIKQEPSADTRAVLINKLNAQLKDKQFKRSQQPFDPNNLPNRSLQPNEENKPKLTPEQFARAGLFNNPYPQYAALGDFTYDKLPGATNPAYLGESVEIKLTQAIRDQAAALNHDPVQIYHWVRNNIVWIPSWGAMQEADITLGSKRGNAFDIASLHIALLRASQIPARYVHGTIEVPADKFMNWAGGFTKAEAAARFASSGGIPLEAVVEGGEIVKIRMEHIWVEAAADFHPSRGAVNLDADSWVEMDASFKQYEHLEGLDVATIAGIDGQTLANDFLASGNINEQEGWISGFDPTILQNAQVQAQTALQDYITANLPDATVGDVIGGAKTIIREAPGLPSSLPNAIKVKGARYAELPASLQPRIHFGLGRDVLGQPVGGITLPWAQVNNHKVTLSYRPATQADEDTLKSLLPEGEITDISQLPGSIPAYLIKVVPELKLNGEVISTGQSLALGEELDLTFTLYHPSYGNRTYYSPVIAGSYQAITTIGGSISSRILSHLQVRTTTNQNKLQSNDPIQIASIKREDILSDMFYAGSLNYFTQYIALTRLLGQSQGAHQGLMPSVGTYGYIPKINYLFGLPRSVEAGGIEIDLDSVTTFTGTNEGNRYKMINFVQQTGSLSSALEHVVPEQMFTSSTIPGEAISATNALAKATASGQRIYHITNLNKSITLSNIQHDVSVLIEINSALNVGKEVITHTNEVNIAGWSGAGYIILDPETGDGAYKISGGLNGGVIDLDDIMDINNVLLYVTTVMDNQDGKPQKWITNTLSVTSKVLAIASFASMVNDLIDDCGIAAAVTISAAINVLNQIIQAITVALTVTLGFAGIIIAILVAVLMNFLNLFLVDLAILGCQRLNLTVKKRSLVDKRRLLA